MRVWTNLQATAWRDDGTGYSHDPCEYMLTGLGAEVPDDLSASAPDYLNSLITTGDILWWEPCVVALIGVPTGLSPTPYLIGRPGDEDDGTGEVIAIA